MVVSMLHNYRLATMGRGVTMTTRSRCVTLVARMHLMMLMVLIMLAASFDCRGCHDQSGQRDG